MRNNFFILYKNNSNFKYNLIIYFFSKFFSCCSFIYLFLRLGRFRLTRCQTLSHEPDRSIPGSVNQPVKLIQDQIVMVRASILTQVQKRIYGHVAYSSNLLDNVRKFLIVCIFFCESPTTLGADRLNIVSKKILRCTIILIIESYLI